MNPELLLGRVSRAFTTLKGGNHNELFIFNIVNRLLSLLVLLDGTCSRHFGEYFP